MDEDVTSLIQRACELATNLGSNLANESCDSVFRCIDEIVAKLNAAKGRLLAVSSCDEEAAKQEIIQQPHQMASSASSSFLQEWLSVSNQYVQIPQLQAPARTPAPPRGTLQIMTNLGARDVDASAEGDVEASPSSRRRKRKDEAEKTTFLFPAAQFGNTDSAAPEDDGYTWRKYGQKEILGSNYPRSYFRCTHQKLYNCPAKKQVQRCDNNPNTFAVTYRGRHTCHMSSTAPSSSVPPPRLIISSQSHDVPHITATSSSQLSPSSTSVPDWLPSVQLRLLAGGGSGGGVTQAGAGAGGADPSKSRFGADYPVADMAVVMFNSGSSSGNNSMESLFASADEKYEAGDNKKS